MKLKHDVTPTKTGSCVIRLSPGNVVIGGKQHYCKKWPHRKIYVGNTCVGSCRNVNNIQWKIHFYKFLSKFTTVDDVSKINHSLLPLWGSTGGDCNRKMFYMTNGIILVHPLWQNRKVFSSCPSSWNLLALMLHIQWIVCSNVPYFT